MKAAVLTDYDRFEIAEVPDPAISSPTDVIVRIAGAGVCGSDVHLAEGALRAFIGDLAFPFVLGHENGGYVEAVGEAVTTLAPGDPVLVHPHISCGLCRPCRRGAETHCERLRFPGVDGSPGGFAELLRTDVRAVVKLPEGTDPAPLSALSDAGLTAYRAVRKAAGHLPPDGTAVVAGVGGVGLFAVQLLRAFSPAQIIATDTDPQRLARAAQLGADATAVAGEGDVDAIKEATDGAGADVVMDCVGVAASTATALGSVRNGGRIVAVGAGDGELCCGTVPMTGRELAFEGSLVGTLGELTELVGITLRGRLELVHTYYPLSEAARAVEDVRAGRVEGRAILRP